MKQFSNILVAIDTQQDLHPALDLATKIARHNGSNLTLVDVVRDFPWMVRLTLTDHSHVRELVQQEKEQRLAALAETVRAQGVDVATKVLFGKTSISVIQEVIRNDHDLVVRFTKGKESQRQGFFGNTAIRLLRKCPCPVWLVDPHQPPEPKHVLACVDISSDDPVDRELNDDVYETARSIQKWNDSRCSVLYSWSMFGEQVLRGHVRPEEFDQIRKADHDHAEKQLDEFLQAHGATAKSEDVHLIKGEPPEVIPHFTREAGVDLVVMGTIGRSGISGMIMGNTAELILNRIECSVLALKSGTFQCPVSLPS